VLGGQKHWQASGFCWLLRGSAPQPNNPPAEPPVANLLREPQSRQQQASQSKTRSAGGQLEHRDDCPDEPQAPRRPAPPKSTHWCMPFEAHQQSHS
jgi:hypothetical protein